MDTLPTIEECQAFFAYVNVKRDAAGMEKLDKLDFDGADPGSSLNCLSARNLYGPAHWIVGGVTLMGNGDEAVLLDEGSHEIPDVVLKVTTPFDAEAEGLRERLEEAGVI